MNATLSPAELREFIRDVPDFPKPGIVFKDITPLLGNTSALTSAVDAMSEAVRPMRPTHLAAMESRGFLFAAPMAERLDAALVPLRKPGKLPWKTFSESYALEYGENSLEVHVDAAGPGDRVVLVDDLLATGGTCAASMKLVRRLGAEVLGAAFLIELDFLDGRAKLPGVNVFSLIRYSGD